MNVREVAVSRLKEYENNPRNNDLAVEKVKYSIQRFGFLFPIVVDVNYVIVAGHTRVILVLFYYHIFLNYGYLLLIIVPNFE